MHVVLFTLALIVLSSLWVFDSAYGRSETRGEASVADITGQVKILRGPAWFFWAWKPLTAGKELLEGDRIQVNAKSSVELVFPNKTHVKILENTLIVIGQSTMYTYEGGQTQCSSVLVKKGEVWVRVEKTMSKVLKFKVESPNTVAGVRGTIFAVRVNRKTTAVAVDEGLVEVSQRKTGEKVLVAGGLATTVSGAGVPATPTVFDENKRTRLKEWVNHISNPNSTKDTNSTGNIDKNKVKGKNVIDKSSGEKDNKGKGSGTQADQGSNSTKDNSQSGNNQSGNNQSGNSSSNNNSPGDNKNSDTENGNTKDDEKNGDSKDGSKDDEGKDGAKSGTADPGQGSKDKDQVGQGKKNSFDVTLPNRG